MTTRRLPLFVLATVGALALVFLRPAPNAAQVQAPNAMSAFASLPTHCTVGAYAYQTSGTVGVFVCTSTDTWTQLAATVGGGGTIVGGTCAAGRYMSAIDGSGNVTCTTGAWTRLAQTVTSGSQATVDFTSISSSYSQLKVVWMGQDTTSGTGASALRLKVNNDGTAANYTSTWRIGSGNAVAVVTSVAASTSGVNMGSLVNSGNTGQVAQGEIIISQYAGTTFHKMMTGTFISDQATGGTQVFALGARWKSTSAINQLTFLTDGTAFTDGSTFTLYGIP